MMHHPGANPTPREWSEFLAQRERLMALSEPPDGSHHRGDCYWFNPADGTEGYGTPPFNDCPTHGELPGGRRCPVHLVPEPCPTCSAYIAAGL